MHECVTCFFTKYSRKNGIFDCVVNADFDTHKLFIIIFMAIKAHKCFVCVVLSMFNLKKERVTYVEHCTNGNGS